MRRLLLGAWGLLLVLGCNPSRREPPPPPEAASEPQPPPPAPEVLQAPPPPAEVRQEPMLTVLSKPSGASVSYAGRLLGKTPLVTKSPVAGDRLVLTLAYAGLGESSHEVELNAAGHFALSVDLNAPAVADAVAPTPSAAPPDAGSEPTKGVPSAPAPKALTAQEKMEARLAQDAARDKAARLAACQDKLGRCQRTAGSCLSEPKVEEFTTRTRRGNIGGKQATWAQDPLHEIGCQQCWQKFETCRDES